MQSAELVGSFWDYYLHIAIILGAWYRLDWNELNYIFYFNIFFLNFEK